MTDEELEKKAKESWWNNQNVSGGLSNFDIYKEGYIAGVKESENPWHNLQKDPNDLPNDDCEVFTIIESDGTLYKSVERYFLDKTDTFDGWGTCQKIIAWCKIPSYLELLI